MKAPRDVRTNDGFIGRGKGTALLKDQPLVLIFPRRHGKDAARRPDNAITSVGITKGQGQGEPDEIFLA